MYLILHNSKSNLTWKFTPYFIVHILTDYLSFYKNNLRAWTSTHIALNSKPVSHQVLPFYTSAKRKLTRKKEDRRNRTSRGWNNPTNHSFPSPRESVAHSLKKASNTSDRDPVFSNPWTEEIYGIVH